MKAPFMNKHLTAEKSGRYRCQPFVNTPIDHSHEFLFIFLFYLFFTAAVVDSQNMRVRGTMGTLILNSTIAKAAPAPLRMWQLLAECYYYPILSQIGSLGTRRVTFQRVKKKCHSLVFRSNETRNQTRRDNDLWDVCKLSLTGGCRGFCFFFLSRVKQIRLLKHITENRMIWLVRR